MEAASEMRHPDPRTAETLTLYPHAGEREWSTLMHDGWKRDLGVEVVPKAKLAGRGTLTKDGVLTSYPYEEGDTIVLGPEVFASADGEVICWKGENYVKQPEPSGAD